MAVDLSVSSNGSTWVKLMETVLVCGAVIFLSVSSNGSTWVKLEAEEALRALK